MGMLSTEHSGELRTLRYVDYERARLEYVAALSHHSLAVACAARKVRQRWIVEQELLGQVHLGIQSRPEASRRRQSQSRNLRHMDSKPPRPTRHAIRANAQIADSVSGQSVSGPTSDVSLAGCFVETPTPLEVKSIGPH